MLEKRKTCYSYESHGVSIQKFVLDSCEQLLAIKIRKEVCSLSNATIDTIYFHFVEWRNLYCYEYINSVSRFHRYEHGISLNVHNHRSKWQREMKFRRILIPKLKVKCKQPWLTQYAQLNQ